MSWQHAGVSEAACCRSHSAESDDYMCSEHGIACMTLVVVPKASIN